jgi:hypothetical protein
VIKHILISILKLHLIKSGILDPAMKTPTDAIRIALTGIHVHLLYFRFSNIYS